MNIKSAFTFVNTKGYQKNLKGRALRCSAISIDFKGFLTNMDFLSYIFEGGTILRIIVFVKNISVIDGFKMLDSSVKECILLRI